MIFQLHKMNIISKAIIKASLVINKYIKLNIQIKKIELIYCKTPKTFKQKSLQNLYILDF